MGNVLGFSVVVLLDTASWQKHLQINMSVYKPLIAVHRNCASTPPFLRHSPPPSEMRQSRNNYFTKITLDLSIAN